MTGEGIDRSSPLPLYHQLKQHLLAEIAARGLGPGARLPGDHELCARFEVSRTVVRQALSEMEFEGVLERVRGRGTFVAQRRPEQTAQALTGLFEDVAARGGTLRTKVLSAQVAPASPEVAEELQVPEGTPVTALERLRTVEGEPWAHTRTYVPQALAPGLEHQDLSSVSLYDVLERRYGVKLAHGRRSIQATVAEPDMAAHLGVPESSPLLVLRSVSVGSDGKPVETYVAHHRGDRSRLEVDLRRREAGPDAPPSPPLMILTR